MMVRQRDRALDTSPGDDGRHALMPMVVRAKCGYAASDNAVVCDQQAEDRIHMIRWRPRSAESDGADRQPVGGFA